MNKSFSKKLTQMILKWRKKKKGHFAVYTREGRRFLVPLNYLNHPIFRVLLEMAEEEFGTKSFGPIQVPCEEGLVGYIMSLLRKNKTEETGDCRVDEDMKRSFNSLFFCDDSSVGLLVS